MILPRRCCTFPRRGFTLLELLAVTTLMALAVTLVTLRLDGFTSAGRVRSAASQVGSYVRLAQTEARMSGQPQIVEIDSDRGEVRVSVLSRTSRQVQEEAQSFKLASTAKLTEVWLEHEHRELEGVFSIRVDGNGRFPRCALLFESQGSWAVGLVQPQAPPRVWVPADRSKAATLDELISEIVQHEAR